MMGLHLEILLWLHMDNSLEGARMLARSSIRGLLGEIQTLND